MSHQIIHVFRHGEAAHNVDARTDIQDPLLTLLGEEQAIKIPETYLLLHRPTLILVSPLRRCIQSALYAFHPDFNQMAMKYFSKIPRILAMPHLQEITENPCDTGSPLEQLKRDYGKYITFEDRFFETDDWLVKSGTSFANNNQLLNERAEFVRKFIKEQSDQEIIVMTHGDFSHFLVNRWLYGVGCGTLFNNLRHAAGIPMSLFHRDGSGYEMHVEIPPWTVSGG
jgi:broad specificity phosphatase PhoE